jgi:hypothetical protein
MYAEGIRHGFPGLIRAIRLKAEMENGCAVT